MAGRCSRASGAGREFGESGSVGVVDAVPVIMNNRCADPALILGLGVSGESGRPRDVAVADGVTSVSAFGENPTRAGVNFAQGEEVGGDVLMSAGKAFLGDGELVHEGEAEVVFF